MVVAMSPLAIDTYLSAMPVMADFFGVGINMIEITLTLYFLGFALGNFFGGPLSDAFGRKPIALAGITLYCLSALIIPFSEKICFIWVLRTLQAFGGGFASVTAMVFVRDWFEGKQVARLATIISMIMMLAPLFAPVLGAALLSAGGWQTIFFFLTAYAILMFLVITFIMPESRQTEYITRRITSQQLIANYKVFFQHKKAVAMLFTISFAMAGMFVFITSSSFIYLEFFGFKHEQFPILFGSNVVFNVILSLMNTRLLKKYEPEQILKTGLWLQLIAGLVFFVSAIMPQPNFWLVFFSIVLYIGSLGMIFGNGTALILNKLPKISGSANATIGVTRFVLSFVAGTLPALFHTGNLVPIGIVLLVCVLTANGFFLLFSKN